MRKSFFAVAFAVLAILLSVPAPSHAKAPQLGSQTISCPEVHEQILSNPPFTLNCTGGASGNPVTYTLLSGPGTLSGTDNATLTYSGTVGTVGIQANQAAGGGYSAATPVNFAITVAQLLIVPPGGGAASPISGTLEVTEPGSPGTTSPVPNCFFVPGQKYMECW